MLFRSGQSGQDGITINADDVTLDLNGFALIGVPGSLTGINVPGAQRNITVMNGSVRDWGFFGIGSLNSSDGRYQDVGVFNSGSNGILVGEGHVILRCTAEGNSGVGISTGDRSIVSHCTAKSNSGWGIEVDSGSTVESCTVDSNTSHGILTENFFDATYSITNCVAVNNGGVGINAQIGGSVIGCTASGNLDGIFVGSGGIALNCSVTENTRDGISVHFNGRVISNNCEDNGAAGIHSTGVGARIEGNSLTFNDMGIVVDSSGNLIVKNSARVNPSGHYNIAAGNSVGPIVNVVGVGDISGVANSNHPWANFVH